MWHNLRLKTINCLLKNGIASTLFFHFWCNIPNFSYKNSLRYRLEFMFNRLQVIGFSEPAESLVESTRKNEIH